MKSRTIITRAFRPTSLFVEEFFGMDQLRA
jgi:hypothetical protein